MLKCNVMPSIIFFLFLRLNGSVNGLKPRIYYYYYYKSNANTIVITMTNFGRIISFVCAKQLLEPMRLLVNCLQGQFWI